MNEFIIEKSTKEESYKINDEIVKYNKSKVPFTQENPFETIDRVIKDNEGNVIAGINSLMYCWNIVTIDILWVDEKYRKYGLGTMLLKENEKVAKEKNCHLIHLDTFDFQAKDFYIKNGYELFGQLDDCPKNHSRYFLVKKL